MSSVDIPELPSWRDRARQALATVARKISLAGVPALVAALGVLAMAIFVATDSKEACANWYAAEADRRAQEGDYEVALICNQWLIRNRGQTPELRFAEAELYRARGDRVAALAAYERLAPADEEGGYAPAHLAAARLLLDGPDPSAASRRAAELHLRRALDSPASEEAAGLLGRLYAATGRVAEAAPLLTRAADREPDLHLLLARLARDRGDTRGARDQAEQARRIFRARAESRRDDPEARSCWAAAEVLRGDFPAALAVLDAGRRLSANPRYAQELAQVYALWADDQPGAAPVPPADRVERLLLGLEADPDSPALLLRLGALIDRKGPDAGLLRSTLLARLTAGRANAVVYAMLGYDALARARPSEARTYFEQAFRLAPGSADLANNLAWALAHADPPDLTHALELVGRALERQPDNPVFRDTRGHILRKLGRYREALPDLEASLAASPNRPETHLALAEVYDHLGLAEPASAHRQAAAGNQRAGTSRRD